jgi:hypothetical protein
MIYPQNFKVAESISHAELVICLKLTSMTAPADALEVFAAVWIPRSQSPDEQKPRSCRAWEFSQSSAQTKRSGIGKIYGANTVIRGESGNNVREQREPKF